MENKEKYELILNHISAHEQQLRSKENAFEEYRQMAYLWLSRKGRHLFAQDILKQYGDGAVLDKVLAQNPNQYVPGLNLPKNGRQEKTWYDIFGTDVIEPDDFLFDYFFICKVRHIDLLELDNYLDYHLTRSFGGDTEKFRRFLRLSLRKHNTLMKPEQAETINEWLAGSEAKATTGAIKSKGKLKRTADDKLTDLSQEQTALLIHYLQETRIILKDEYLNNKQAGEAFSALTGYSPDTLRLELGDLKKTKKNLTPLYNTLTRLTIMINKQIGGK